MGAHLCKINPTKLWRERQESEPRSNLARTPVHIQPRKKNKRLNIEQIKNEKKRERNQ